MTNQILGIRTLRPTSPELRQALAGRFIVSATGHRPDKLGGYGEDAGTGAITSFRGTYAWLSNFHAVRVELDGAPYASVEAAYQAAKTLDPAERKRIRLAPTPGHAKRLGKEVTLRADWDRVKVKVMEQLLRQKFQHPELRARLAATEGRSIQEHNTWNDTFWGLCKGSGQNMMGLLLMKLRQEILERGDFTPHQHPHDLLVTVAKTYLRRLSDANPDLTVITGMALGWDTAVATAAKTLDIPFIAALPFPKQASRWPEAARRRWSGLLRFAAEIVVVGSDELADADLKSAMQWRNEFMVDHAHLILACYDGTPGGTHNCVLDAEQQGKRVLNTYGEWLRSRPQPEQNTGEPPREGGVLVNHGGHEFLAYRMNVNHHGSALWLGEYDGHSVIFNEDTLQRCRVTHATPSTAAPTPASSCTHPKFGQGIVLHTEPGDAHTGKIAEVQFADTTRKVAVRFLQF